MLLQSSLFFPFAPFHPAPAPSGNPYTTVHVRGSSTQTYFLNKYLLDQCKESQNLSATARKHKHSVC